MSRVFDSMLLKIGIKRELSCAHGKPIFLHMEVLRAHRDVGRSNVCSGLHKA